MKQWIRKMYESSVIRYIFFGGCTTMVNLVSFFILRKLKVELNIANICLLYTSPSPRDRSLSRMPSSA